MTGKTRTSLNINITRNNRAYIYIKYYISILFRVDISDYEDLILEYIDKAGYNIYNIKIEGRILDFEIEYYDVNKNVFAVLKSLKHVIGENLILNLPFPFADIRPLMPTHFVSTVPIPDNLKQEWINRSRHLFVYEEDIYGSA